MILERDDFGSNVMCEIGALIIVCWMNTDTLFAAIKSKHWQLQLSQKNVSLFLKQQLLLFGQMCHAMMIMGNTVC